MNPIQKTQLTPLDTALDFLLPQLPIINEQENVSLVKANGRVLAEDCVSAINVPAYTNSAMDGYAIKVSDLGDKSPSLKISQRIAAGEAAVQLHPGEAARIFTGAPVPAGADAVVMQENCTVDADLLTVLQPVQAGENLREAGDDIKAGVRVLARGHRLKSQDVGLLASIGKEQLAVKRKLRVSLLTSGDELVQPGTDLGPGQIYNSNFYTLFSLLESLDVEVLDAGIVPDDFAATRRALLAAAERSDCVISTGGVSVGEEDHVKAAVEKEGILQLWKLAIKPGKPLACGTLGTTQFFGLPGNPVSAFVTFALFVRPCLLTMLECARVKPQKYWLPSGFVAQAGGERQQYLRCKLLDDERGNVCLMPYSNQGSAVAVSLNQADGLAIVPPCTSVAIGDSLGFIPFSEILN